MRFVIIQALFQMDIFNHIQCGLYSPHIKELGLGLILIAYNTQQCIKYIKLNDFPHFVTSL